MTGPRADASVSVVVPAYNEAARIGETLHRIAEHLERRRTPFEILVVDDGSTDGTAAAVEAHPAAGVRLLRQPANRGKGAAVRAGVLASRHDLVLVCDADLSTPIAELDRLATWIEDSAIVIASRQAPGARVARSWLRRLASQLFNAALRVLGLCRGIRDTQCGFKLLRGAEARSLFGQMEVDGFAFDIELLELARYRGLGVREVGVTWLDTGESSVSLVHHAPGMLRDAMALRRRLRGLRRRDRAAR
ncbi:MAG: glycosyltransferase family 2 protein [Acidobacteriota bacterium]|nr:glycosyltransferase family 2 protein [Acidobacteriota bacterium]